MNDVAQMEATGDLVVLTIDRAGEGRDDVAALPVGALFVHNDACDGWTISHFRGFAVLKRFPSSVAAIRCAEHLAAIADWSQDVFALRDAKIGAAVDEVGKEYGGLRTHLVASPEKVARALADDLRPRATLLSLGAVGGLGEQPGVEPGKPA